MTQETLPFAGCPWPVDLTCIDEDAWEEFPPEVREYAVAVASTVLHRLSGRIVGGCPIVVRPAPRGNACMPAYGAWMSPGINRTGFWVNNCCLDTSTYPSCALELPAPVGRIDSIKIDGVEQDLSEYRVDNGNVLVFQGNGDCPIPQTQDLRLPDTAEGTFSITYLNSYPPDRFAAQAVTALAWEFAVACTSGDGECRLPSGVTTVVRTGVTMELAQGLFPDGFTGIEAVDAWISVVNPTNRKRPTKIWSPDSDEPWIQGRAGASPTSWDGGSPDSGGDPIDGGAP